MLPTKLDVDLFLAVVMVLVLVVVVSSGGGHERSRSLLAVVTRHGRGNGVTPRSSKIGEKGNFRFWTSRYMTS